MKSSPLLEFNDKGIYCAEADVYLDPWRPVDKALITHGHADHSCYGHKRYITHHSNVPIISHRLGDINVSGVAYGEEFTVNGVKFSFFPAGHIIGSSQIRVEFQGEVWVYSGDYKVENDGISVPFEPIKCHTFITECTFGLPVFKWQPQQDVYTDINDWWVENKSNNQTSVLFGYTLGKAQRLLHGLNPEIGKIYTHAAVENMTEILRSQVYFPETHRITKDTKKEEFSGSIVIAPPSAHGSPWIRKMTPYVTASASGWMATRGARRRRALDKGFVMSDHCDWYGLLAAIKATEATEIVCTHGYTEIFSKYLKTIGYNARTEKTAYEDEEAHR